MPRYFFAATALAAALAAPAFAQQEQGHRPAPAGPVVKEKVVTVPAEGGAGQATLPAGSGAEPVLPVQEKLDPERERAAERRPGAERFVAAQDQGEMMADEIIGTKVVNARGEEVGQVKGLLFHGDGRIAAAVIGVGGFLGLGEKDVALRWGEVGARPDANGGDARLAVDLTKEDLEQAPTFKTLAAIRAEEAVKDQEESMLKKKDAGPAGAAPAQRQRTAPATN